MRLETTWTLALAALLCLSPSGRALSEGGSTERVNVSSSGTEGNGPGNLPALSADGNLVAFQSSANDLVPGDTNFSADIFVRDRLLGVTTRVSLSSSGGQGNHHSKEPAISADGRYVLFNSRASNLVSGDSNGFEDIFLHDRNTGATTRISVDPAGQEVFGSSYYCELTPDGVHACFTSPAATLVAGDTNAMEDVFVRNLVTGTTTRVSISTGGAQGDLNSREGAMSDDGQTVTFQSHATTLVAGDTNGSADVFVHEIASGQTTRVSVSSGGTQGSSYSTVPSISAGARYVAFQSRASNLVASDTNAVDDVFLHDRQTRATTMVSVDSSGVQGDYYSYRPALTADGRCVAFGSWAGNLVAGDTNGDIDVFVHDTLTQSTQRVSVDSSGLESNGHSQYAAITADGSVVAFESGATNLVAGDTNGWSDVFVHEYAGPMATAYCTAGTSASGCAATLCGLGVASATAPSGFTVSAANVEGAKDGLYFFGASGRQANSWGNGTSYQCVVPPVKRGGVITGVGTAGLCDGSFAQDLNVLWCPACPKPGHNPGAGALVQAQLWYRDPQNTGNQTTSLSNAIEFLVTP
jgi:hypothetical protein